MEIAVEMKKIFVGKGVFIIERNEVAVCPNTLVNIAGDRRIFVQPFRAGVGKIATLRIVTVICTKRLCSVRVVKSSLDYACCRREKMNWLLPTNVSFPS